MNDGLYMSAEEAAAALGVSVTTIYAYVSRKIIRSHKPPGTRVSKYWRADIERVRQKLPVGVARRDANPLVSETQITVITDAGPFYRGQSAVELSETETLESVAALLWQVDEQAIFPPEAPSAPRALEKLWPMLKGLTTVDKAMAAFPIIERHNPRAHDLSPAGFARTGAEVMRWFATIMVGAERPSGEPLHMVVTSRSPNGAALQDVVRRLLVLSADHELDPTTYVVRAVANTGVNPYRIALTGLTASTGRRLAFGRVEALSRLLEEIATAAEPEDAVVGRLRDGETLPGFGSRLYSAGDPRAASLLAALNRNLHGDAELKKFNAAITVVREVTGQEPDLALVNLFLGRKLGLVRQDGITLRLGRIAGWIAHAMEQYHGQDLVRPRASYVGLLPSKVQTRPAGTPEAPSAPPPPPSPRRQSAKRLS